MLSPESHIRSTCIQNQCAWQGVAFFYRGRTQLLEQRLEISKHSLSINNGLGDEVETYFETVHFTKRQKPKSPPKSFKSHISISVKQHSQLWELLKPRTTEQDAKSSVSFVLLAYKDKILDILDKALINY